MKSIVRTLDQLRYEKCQDFLLVSGGILILYIGRVHSIGPLICEYTLWINSAWRLEKDGYVLAGSLDNSEYSCKKLLKLKKRRLIAISYDRNSGDITLRFDEDVVLKTFVYSKEDDQWEFRRNDGFRLGIGPQKRIYQKTYSAKELNEIDQIIQQHRNKRRKYKNHHKS